MTRRERAAYALALHLLRGRPYESAGNRLRSAQHIFDIAGYGVVIRGSSILYDDERRLARLVRARLALYLRAALREGDREDAIRGLEDDLYSARRELRSARESSTRQRWPLIEGDIAAYEAELVALRSARPLWTYAPPHEASR